MNPFTTLKTIALVFALGLLAACNTGPAPVADGVEELGTLVDANGDVDVQVSLKITGTVAGSGAGVEATALPKLLEVEATTPKGATVRGLITEVGFPAVSNVALKGRVINVRGVPAFIGIMQEGDQVARTILVGANKTLPNAANASLKPSYFKITLEDVLVSSIVRRPANWNGSSDYMLFRTPNGTPFTVGAGAVTPAGQLPAGQALEVKLNGSVEVLDTRIGPVGRGTLTFVYEKITWTIIAVLIGL